MKNTGIWLDNHNAMIVTLEKDEAQIQKIQSEVEDFKESGGYGGSDKHLGQDVAWSASKLMERKQHQLKAYFKEITEKINDSEKIVIMGPAQARIAFEKEIKTLAHLAPKIVANEPADKMTENQFVAKVKGYF